MIWKPRITKIHMADKEFTSIICDKKHEKKRCWESLCGVATLCPVCDVNFLTHDWKEVTCKNCERAR